MLNAKFKKILFILISSLVIFSIDRFSKIYILNLAEVNDVLNIYINEFFNLYLIWNTGIGFGLLSTESNLIYNSITLLIVIINLIILIMIFKSKNYYFFLLLLVFGGSTGNLFDRIYYNAVPDFIDLHYKEFHWFIFNVADIFITIGLFCLIFAEIFINNKKQVNEDK